MKDKSFDVTVVDRYKAHWVQTGQARLDAQKDADRAHNSDQSKAVHPDWRESSGIALPTVEELHYAHDFLNRAVERRLKSFPRPLSAQALDSLSPPEVAMELNSLIRMRTQNRALLVPVSDLELRQNKCGAAIRNSRTCLSELEGRPEARLDAEIGAGGALLCSVRSGVSIPH